MFEIPHVPVRPRSATKRDHAINRTAQATENIAGRQQCFDRGGSTDLADCRYRWFTIDIDKTYLTASSSRRAPTEVQLECAPSKDGGSICRAEPQKLHSPGRG